ncbi:LuxR C-terminal-related transcriptional regulator [Chryseobacterium arachidis]
MYADGYGNLEIANTLDVKQNTISTLKKRIFEKLNIDNIVQLIEMIKNHY